MAHEKDTMKIAPDFDSSQWSKLNLADPASNDWETAISVLKSRLYSRFIDAADILLSIDDQKPLTERRFGFAILAIDCALIETLAAFQDGLTNTKDQSKATFAKFLSSSSGFSKHFTLSRAKQFYEDFRCGILHQAETAGQSKVWSVGELIRDESGVLIVNRSKFHEQLKIDFDAYLAALGDPTNRSLRRKFRKKMGFICRM
jgi:hypothetical protein